MSFDEVEIIGDSRAPMPTPVHYAPVDRDFKENFAITISAGLEEVVLSNGYSMWVSPEGFGSSTTTWRKEQAESRFYHGSYLVHATKANIIENITVYLRGESQNDVTENIMLLEELFGQPSFQIKVQFGNHRETWYCQTADSWQIDRGHVMMHNHMAKVSVSVPRLPDTTKEIVL